MAVARVTQPYRVAGRRVPPAAPALDEAWTARVRGRMRDRGTGTGCRWSSAGAPAAPGSPAAPRRALGAAGVLALAFPLHPPGRPERHAAPTSSIAGVPTLVVNGDRDPFGVPDRTG